MFARHTRGGYQAVFHDATIHLVERIRTLLLTLSGMRRKCRKVGATVLFPPLLSNTRNAQFPLFREQHVAYLSTRDGTWLAIRCSRGKTYPIVVKCEITPPRRYKFSLLAALFLILAVARESRCFFRTPSFLLRGRYGKLYAKLSTVSARYRPLFRYELL